MEGGEREKANALGNDRMLKEESNETIEKTKGFGQRSEAQREMIEQNASSDDQKLRERTAQRDDREAQREVSTPWSSGPLASQARTTDRPLSRFRIGRGGGGQAEQSRAKADEQGGNDAEARSFGTFSLFAGGGGMSEARNVLRRRARLFDRDCILYKLSSALLAGWPENEDEDFPSAPPKGWRPS